jgi:hypothetical protein
MGSGRGTCLLVPGSVLTVIFVSFMVSNCSSFRFLSWNVRGLGDLLKCDIVKEMIRVNRLDLVLLQETKHHSINSFMSSTFLPANLKSCSVPGRNRCLPGAAFSLEPY